MPRLPIGIITLLIVSVLIYFGMAQRVLDRLRLSDKAALGIIAALIIGGFINIPLPRGPRLEASLNIGGGLVPLLLSGYLITTSGSTKEKLRAITGIAATAGAVYLTGVLMGADPETMLLDPLYIYPLVGGLVAYLTGRSRRSAFIAATVGILLVDFIIYIRLLVTGTPGAVLIGGGGAFDAVVIAGLLAVLLAEFVGETREWLQGGPRAGRAPALLKHLRPLSNNKKKDKEGDALEQDAEGGEQNANGGL
ncbi:MAG TPA: DUF1614 domain-containing protein [Syntrophomonadaceae bacterium]|nr:DUF1614 domain-containing protein [Syntrophomonadaceae bacterium]